MNNYCPHCGTALELGSLGQRQRAFCPRCRQVHYAQLKVGAGALVEREGRLLLLRRTQAPFQGCWNLPAGYVEADESPLEAVVRETYEETGLRVEARGLVDVYYFADDPRGNGILIVYACCPVGGKLQAGQESADPTFFAAGEIPELLAGGGHDRAIRAWRGKTYYLSRRDDIVGLYDTHSLAWRPFLALRYGHAFAEGVIRDAREIMEGLIPELPYIGGDENPILLLLSRFCHL